MRIRLLGTAAGGGFPQWNCNCALCRDVRGGSKRLRPRTQSCVAISADERRWFLLNASPDIRAQIENFPALHPPAGVARGTPIEAVLLTNADLDHTLGLMLLREGARLHVHATTQVREALISGLSLAPTLEFFCGIEWIRPPEESGLLPCRDGSPSGLRYQAIPIPGKPPRFMEGRVKPSRGDSIAYAIVDEKTGGRLLFMPDAAGLNDSILSRLIHCDALLFDGTFWSENEMRDSGVGEVTATQMGHIPISGEHGSLKRLGGLAIENKIYVHINNTNPILLENSPEHRAVLSAGVQIGADGMEVLI